MPGGLEQLEFSAIISNFFGGFPLRDFSDKSVKGRLKRSGH